MGGRLRYIRMKRCIHESLAGGGGPGSVRGPGGRTIKLAPITLRLRSLHHAMPEPKATTADDVDDLDGMPYTL